MVYDFRDGSSEWRNAVLVNADTGEPIRFDDRRIVRIDIETGDYDAYLLGGCGELITMLGCPVAVSGNTGCRVRLVFRDESVAT